jgi:hypothetical protein
MEQPHEYQTPGKKKGFQVTILNGAQPYMISVIKV